MTKHIVIYLAILVIGFLIAKFRRRDALLGKKTAHCDAFATSNPPEAATDIIVQFAETNGYKVSAQNEEKGELVLEDKMDLNGPGFFFPVTIQAMKNEGAWIEVGVESKAGSGSNGDLCHKKCVEGIQRWLYAEQLVKPKDEK